MWQKRADTLLKSFQKSILKETFFWDSLQKKEENVAEKGRHTDTPLHKTFRDPTEIDARSNRKKEFKTDGLPKRACCVLVYSFFIDQSNLKIQNFKMKSQNNSSFSYVGCPICVYPSASNPRRRHSPNKFYYASCSISDLSHCIPTLFDCLHQLCKILVQFFQKNKKIKENPKIHFLTAGVLFTSHPTALRHY